MCVNGLSSMIQEKWDIAGFCRKRKYGTLVIEFTMKVPSRGYGE